MQRVRWIFKLRSGGGPCFRFNLRVYARIRAWPFLLGKASEKYSKSQHLHVFFKKTPQEAHGALRRAKTGPVSHIRRKNDRLLGFV
jgi:hypothetical protein